MLSFHGRSPSLCDGLNRREWLRVGSLGMMGLSLPELLKSRASNTVQAAAPATLSSFGKAKNCIVLFLLGGPPQHETWDPKPDAPQEIRGEFGTIGTATPGFRVGELMPLTAKHTDKIAVLRALATDDNAHSSSGYWMLTGQPHAPMNSENALPGAPNDWPSFGAMVRKVKGDRGALPGAIRVPEDIWNTGRIPWPGQDAGWLGSNSDPWLVTCDPHKPDFKVPSISLPGDLSRDQFDQRRSFLNHLNRRLDLAQAHPLVQSYGEWQSKAIDMIRAPEAQRAFQLEQETDKTRDRYGRNRFGQSVLMARRMVESGVSLVQVNWTRGEDDDNVSPAWDSHANHNKRIKDALMPPMDQAYSALLEDLEERGMLEETLVVWIGEFGRTPRFNAAAGRDHWGHVFSGALAGGGVQGGAVFGSSDRHGAYPLEGRVEPQDLHATMFHCLGINPDTEVHDKAGRPFAVSKGSPITSILS